MKMEARIEFAGFNEVAPATREALSAVSKAVNDSGLEKALTAILWRPLARRRLRTAAPALVFMRVRKPWVLARWRRLG